MNMKAVIAVAMAFNMAAGSMALAQGNYGRGDRGDRGRGNQGQQGNDRGNYGADNDRRNDRGYSNYEHDRRNFGRSHNEYKRQGRGSGPGYEYYRGDRLPVEYRARQYWVEDWRAHNLTPPPRGYQWVQSGSDYILIAIATGVILQLLLGR